MTSIDDSSLQNIEIHKYLFQKGNIAISCSCRKEIIEASYEFMVESKQGRSLPAEVIDVDLLEANKLNKTNLRIND